MTEIFEENIFKPPKSNLNIIVPTKSLQNEELHNYLNSIYTSSNNEVNEKKKFVTEWLERKFKNWLGNICKDQLGDNESYKMIIGGSTFLETAGPDSDLDIIFIFPQKCLCPLPNNLADCGKCKKNGNIRFCTKHDLFFGSNAQSFAFYLKNEIYNVETVEEFQFKGYSMSDTYINSIENARVPIISISISGIEMDIMTAPIPFDNIPDNFELTNIENEKVVNKNNKLLNELIEAMIKQNDQFYNKSILVLTGFRIAYRNKSKFIQSEIQSSLFVDLMRAVKLWAKRKQIYSNVFGYLSGTILTIMATKVNLLYNSGGLTFLLQQFFKFYSEWQWPLPVLIEPLTNQELIKTKYLSKENNYLIDSWNLSNIKETPPSVMPIISSQFPEQNVAFNVNEFTKNIILREIEKEKINLKEYHSISGFERERECKRINGIDEHWTVWLIGINLENNRENINKQKELLLTINEHFWKINKEENWLNAIYVNQNNLKNMWD
uniref:polynucleotide adenylyltransferase n=1 Tax=Meloidogyne enterolobii TaxID=390850 RepID=A0A6V7UPA5_MELEN|nr:unnamed protein product [Meloidogyne enterolobii]